MTDARAPHPDDWRPHPGPQSRFLSLTCFEALYGGAAGGGKSESLLIDAVRYVGRGYGSAYQAILFRRSFPDLEKSLIERSRLLYPRLGGVYNEGRHVWRFPSGERVLFSHLEHDSSVQDHQSAEYQFVGFDELTHFSRHQYTYLLSRVRSSRGVPVRIRSATNPGGDGHDWVFERWRPWLDPAHPQRVAAGQVVYLRRQEGVEVVVPKGTSGALGRCFVPARLSDNPSLAASDYGVQLEELDPVTYQRLRWGNWLIKPARGLYFKRNWFARLEARPLGARWVRAWDLAATLPTEDSPDPDWTCGVLMGQHGDQVVVADVVRLRGGPGDVEAAIKVTAANDGVQVPIVLPQDPGQAGVSQIAAFRRLLPGHAVLARRPTGDKITRAGPFSSAAFGKRCAYVAGAWNDAYFATLESFPDGHDDDVDASADAYAEVATPTPSLPMQPPRLQPRRI